MVTSLLFIAWGERCGLENIQKANFKGGLSILLEKTERSDTTIVQSSIFNFGLSGLGLNPIDSCCLHRHAMA
jgi:hypothetical protein